METTNTLILLTNISESAFLQRSQTTPLNCLNVFLLFSKETWAASFFNVVINTDVFKNTFTTNLFMMSFSSIIKNI